MANGTLKVQNIETSSGSGTITLGQSGETIALGSGVTSKMNQPAFEAYLSADQTISDNVSTKVQFDTEVFDTDNCYDNTTNYRFTPNVAGKYYVYTYVECNGLSNANLSLALIYFMKNGSQISQSTLNAGGNNIKGTTVSTNFVLDMNGTTDYLEVFGQINVASSTPRFDGESRKVTVFGAYRIGAE